MIKLKKSISGVIAVSFLAAMLSGCQKPAGPAEQAGKEIDKAAETAAQKIEQAGEAIQDTAKKNMQQARYHREKSGSGGPP